MDSSRDEAQLKDQTATHKAPSEPASAVATAEIDEQQGDKASDGSVDTPSFPAIDEVWNDDVDRDGSDSAVGGLSTTSSISSIQSSLYESVEENGFSYHRYKQGKYPLPNDVREQERLDLQHALWGVTLRGKQYLAPIEDPKNVLDIGTGTGIWAIEFSQKFPLANVIGTDLSAIQPLFVPPNCHFEIDDAEDEWVFSHKFDYIHGRALVSCFADPSFVIQQAFNALEPGGILELNDGIFPMEYVGEPRTDSHLYKWNTHVIEAAQKVGRPLTNVQHYARWMREIGFEDVEEKKFYWPTSPWAKGQYLKEIGSYVQADFTRGLEGMSMKLLTLGLGWTPEAVKEFIEGAKKDFMDTNIHAYMPIRVVIGKKPASQPST